MNDRPQRDREFNTPFEMLVRGVYLVSHAALAAGILLCAAGLLSRHGGLLASGLLALVAAWGGRSWLSRQEDLEPSERTLVALTRDGPPLDDARVAELIGLLETWETLEQKRGSPDFDPWAVQAIRHDIRAVVESDPALEQLFTALQKAA